jgi:hypothetical protein
MKYNFCTLFDSNYLSRGVNLYNSLENNCSNFHLYIFAFDQKSFLILNELKLKNATIISLEEFENDELLKVKPTRTRAEYCWTCTSETILYCLNNYDIDNCTYLDADMFFYSSLEPVFEEIGSASIAITEHNYTPKYDQSGTSGKYCVQFVFFRKDSYGLKALNWWKDACLDWCYARLEDGKFGDQKYLDDWTERFENVHVINNRGVGVAPWNVQQFKLSDENKKVLKLSCINNRLSFNLIFYHFHNLNFKWNQSEIEVAPSKFDLSLDIKNNIYIPYIENLLKTESSINGFVIQNDFNYKFSEYPFYIKLFLPIRILLKKVEMFRAINRYFIKTSRK